MFASHEAKYGISPSKMGKMAHFKEGEMLHHGKHILNGCEVRT
jgi:hypothetical protein